MNKQTEALKMAIEALENIAFEYGNLLDEKQDYGLLPSETNEDIINAYRTKRACKEALEQPQEVGDAEIKQMLDDIEWYQKRVEELEQPAQEPVALAWLERDEVMQILNEFPLLDDEGLDEDKHHCEWTLQQDRKRLHTMLNTTHPAPSWQVLSDDEIRTLFARNMEHDSYGVMNNFARAIEQALRTKNGN